MKPRLIFLTAIVWVPAALGQPGSQPSGPSSWPMEVVRLRNGIVLKGLILDADERALRMLCVSREPGRPTVTFHTSVGRVEIDRIERLSASERQELRNRLNDLERCSGEAARCRLAQLPLRSISENGRNNPIWQYDSAFFSLKSDAHEEIVRRAAWHLEQIYTAYTRFLAPRHKGGVPTQIMLCCRLMSPDGPSPVAKSVQNPAYFEPIANRIICHCELQEWGERLQAIRAEHFKLRAELEEKKAAFARLYKGRELHRIIQPIERTHAEIAAAEIKNNQAFAVATRNLFARLNHEAFHAYLLNFVYPATGPQPPRWLNEGLAQIFESAILEGTELRVGHADRDRLDRVVKAIPRQELVPLADLFRSEPRHFLVAHDTDRLTSDRYYLTSWALAFYLTFDKRLLGSAALDRFVSECHNGTSPTRAFEEMVGEPLESFQRQFYQYLSLLQPDGSLRQQP
jgi:hypothetical protein